MDRTTGSGTSAGTGDGAALLSAVQADLRAAEAHLQDIDGALLRLDEHRARAIADRDLTRKRVAAARAELGRLEALGAGVGVPPVPAAASPAAGPASAATPAAAAASVVGRPISGAPPGPPARRHVPAAVLLLGVGAVLLLSAAAVFVALSWGGLGVAQQAGLLAGATAASAVACVLLRRARLRQGAETFAAVTAGLLLLDLVGARAFDLAGLGAVPADVWTLLTAVVLAGAGTCVSVVTWTPPPPDDPPVAPRTGRPPLLAAAVVAVAAVPVALVALVVVVSGVAEQVQGLAGGTALLVGVLDGLLVAGLAGSLLGLALRTTGPAALVRATARTGGLALLAALALVGLVTAAVLPWWWPSAGAGDADVLAVVARLLALTVVAVVLAVVPLVLGRPWGRASAGATAAAVTTGLLVAVAALAGLTRDVGLTTATAVLLVVVLAVPGVGATWLRRGVAVVVLGLGVVGALLLLGALVLALLAPVDGLATAAWSLEQWLETSRTAATGAATVVLAVLGAAGLGTRAARRRSGGSAAAAAGDVRPLRPAGRWTEVAAVVAVAAASVTWWGWLATDDGAARWAGAAVLAVLLVTAVSVATTRGRLRTYRWRLGPLRRDPLLGVVVAWAVHSLLATLAAEDAGRGDGLVAAGVLLLAGTGTLLVAVVGTRGGALRPPVRRPGREVVVVARDVTVTTGVALLAVAAALTAHARPVLHGPLADGVVAALVVTAVAAGLLLRLPAWPGARTGAAGLGAATVALALGGTVLGVKSATLPPLVPGSADLLQRDGLVWLVGALAVAVQAVAVTAPRHGVVPVRTPTLRHLLLPGPLLVVGVAALWSGWPLVRRLPLDVEALPATVVLLVLAGYVAVAVRVDPTGPWAPRPPVRALGRDLLVPLLLGLAGATLVAAARPLLDPDVVAGHLLAWAGLPASVVLATSVALRRADPALVAGARWARDVARPLAVAATLLLLLSSARPTTGLPAEVETLLVAAVGLLVHLVREALRSAVLRADGGPGRAAAAPGGAGGSVGAGGRPTVRDAIAVLTTTGLGALGVLAALAGERPLWVAGLTWWLLGVSALAVVVLSPGQLAGPRPVPPEARAWWAMRVGAAASVVGWLLAAVDLDWPPDRLTVPVGLVLAGFGLAALRATTSRPGAPGTVRLLGPGLALAAVPSAVLAVVDPVAPRPLVVAVAGSLLVALGAWRRWRAPLLVGALVVVPVAVVQALPFVVSVPQWVYLAAAGVLALAVGITFERARQQAQEAGRRWRELR
ncbi:hypothetical protein [Jannaschia sp. R86511]|uniref:hypothetical protein n=1 Tax=Jannaschia sp. R86511 TaxID=3093853 RepID=UPI0036D3C608